MKAVLGYTSSLGNVKKPESWFEEESAPALSTHRFLSLPSLPKQYDYLYHTNFALNINRILDIFKEHRRMHTGSADAKNFIHGPGASLLRTLRQLTDKEAAKVHEILSYFEVSHKGNCESVRH